MFTVIPSYLHLFIYKHASPLSIGVDGRSHRPGLYTLLGKQSPGILKMEFERCSDRGQVQGAVEAPKRSVYTILEIGPNDEHWRGFGVCRVGELGDVQKEGGQEHST